MGEKMWSTMLEAGEKHNLKVIAPGHHRRIEAGLLSYGQDLDIEVNPFECGQGWQVDLTKDAFVGKDALAKIKAQGVSHKGELVGYVTSAWYSPTQGSNIALAMLPVDLTEVGTDLQVALPTKYSNEPTVPAKVEKTP